MSRLIETIKIDRGKICRLNLHQARLNRSRQELLGRTDVLNLAEIIQVPQDLEGPVKCRIIYSEDIESITYTPHKKRQINSLKLVYDDGIDYTYKLEDRSKLEFLFKQRAFCDDVLIIRNGMVTDSYYANVVFYDGQSYVTPKACLLKGVQRTDLLNQGLIQEAEISMEDIFAFQEIHLINVFQGLGDVVIPVKSGIYK